MVIAGLLKLDSAHGLPGKLVKMQNQIQQFWWGWGVQRVCILRSNQVMVMVMLMLLVLWVARVQNADRNSLNCSSF